MITETKSSWGGVREGAGRKPRLQYEARECFNEIFDRYADKLTTATIYHAVKGDKEMLRWLIEQRIGRAAQSVDMTSRSVSWNLSTQSDVEGADRVMEIAERVSAELKKIKTA